MTLKGDGTLLVEHMAGVSYACCAAFLRIYHYIYISQIIETMSVVVLFCIYTSDVCFCHYSILYWRHSVAVLCSVLSQFFVIWRSDLTK